ncbi:hypothetical protein DIX90_08975 [Streptococcus iniae]|uniref:YopX family protein n=1 Tax=Streptococcus iniae TaxID=1346 RepID=UPI000EF6A795|nr:YopX family protein [Streptococcus iniae]RLU51578.1 hypothetical protein DIY04_10625 [Streptococcus iniae]RLU58552.1 hypothetical protein DIY02_08960 [Streptococcus iniae]RLU60544.1 hypothetical protein DIY01_08780 [Streptococcus iniae]RLU68704.1 hypothetical protein DIX97_09090 [Streptococcus iniae]RLU82694.1 hypothetical protein DIX91_08745 [Streptococcus iniae]
MIKFRAWGKVANVMIYNIEQTYDGLGYFQENEDIEDYVSDISFGCFADWLENDQFVIMQSTGLFDKNGKEIFENDIVLTTIFVGRADENGCFYEYEKEYKGVVRMLEGAWIIDTGKDVADLWTEVDENEVIGNIHQNSDLLESVEE